MPVVCIEDEKIYMLKNKTHIMLEDGWVECAGGGNYVVLS